MYYNPSPHQLSPAFIHMSHPLGNFCFFSPQWPFKAPLKTPQLYRSWRKIDRKKLRCRSHNWDKYNLKPYIEYCNPQDCSCAATLLHSTCATAGFPCIGTWFFVWPEIGTSSPEPSIYSKLFSYVFFQLWESWMENGTLLQQDVVKKSIQWSN